MVLLERPKPKVLDERYRSIALSDSCCNKYERNMEKE